MKKGSKKEKEIQQDREQDTILISPDDTDDDLRELTELLGEGEYKVSVYKLSTDGTQWEKIGQFPLDQFNPDEIAKTYNGGKFKFRVIDSSGKFVKQITTPYAVPKQEVIQEPKKDELLDFIKTELISRDTLLAKLVENLKPQSQSNLTELITALSSLKSMEKSQFNFNDILGVLKMGMNMTKELQDNVVPDTQPVEQKFINTMIDKLLPNLISILSGGVSRGLSHKPPAPPLSVPNNQNNINNTTQNNMQNINYLSPFEKKLIENFKLYEKPLLAQSVNPNSVPNVVNIILSMLKDDDIIFLEKYLKEYSYHRIINYIPNLASIRDYLKVLVDNLLETIEKMYETEVSDEVSDENLEKPSDEVSDEVSDENKENE